MAWLRIDDGFAFHPKVVQLSRSERWTWLEILCYCARYRTDGDLPSSISEAVPKANRSFLTKCAGLGLLDLTDEPSYVVHDWLDFNPKDPTAAERKQRERSRKGHEDVTETTVTENVTKRDSRVATRARPVPSPKETTHPSLLPELQDVDGRTENSTNEIDALRLNPLETIKANL